MLKCSDPKIASLLTFRGELVGFALHPCALTEAVRVHDEHHDVYILFSGCLHLTTNGRARYNASHKIVGDLRRCPSFLVSWVTVPAAGAAPSIMWISVSWMDRKWYSPKSSSSSTCKNAGWKYKVTWRAMRCHAVSKAVCTELGTKMNKAKWTVELLPSPTLTKPHLFIHQHWLWSFWEGQFVQLHRILRTKGEGSIVTGCSMTVGSC